MATHAKNFTAAATYTIYNVNRLESVLVGTGVASATVVIQYATSNDAIATLDAANPDIGRIFNLEFSPPTNLEVILDDATDVTVFYD